MDFATPWIPTLNGQHVRSFTLLDFSARVNTSPETKAPRDDAWTVEAQQVALRSVAKAPRAALLETVLWLWRLKELEGFGSEDPLWGDMVEAWLVRDDSG